MDQELIGLNLPVPQSPVEGLQHQRGLHGGAHGPADSIQIPSGISTETEATMRSGDMDNQFSNNVFNFTHLVMMYRSLAAAKPNLNLGDLLTPEAKGQIDALM